MSFAISPDGSKLVFVASGSGFSRLWLRSMDTPPGQPLTGTDGASYPFWSPDSRSIGFFADGKLKRVDIDGGALQVLASTVRLPGGSWNREGVILYSATRTIWRVSSSGGDPVEITQAGDVLTGHLLPHFLPDGHHFLFYSMGPPDIVGVYLADLDRKETRRLMLSADSAAIYSPGHLLFARQGTLFAQPFDTDRLTLTGNQSAIAVDIPYGTLLTRAAAFASAAGVIAYRSSPQDLVQNLAWFDRSGRQLKRIDAIDRARGVSLSSDGRRVTLSREQTPAVTDVWVVDISREAPTKFTINRASNPTWSPDGNRIVYTRSGTSDLYVNSTSSGGAEELLFQSLNSKSATDWSPDGHFVLYRESDPKGGYDIWAVAVNGERKAFPLVQTPSDERDGQFSPDGKWIAYQSNESGRYEIYVQPFPGPGPKSMVSNGGGTQVRWRRDGSELFYVAPDRRMMAVPTRSSSNGAVEAGTPLALFQTRLASTAGIAGGRQQYDVSRDGQQFLMNTYADTGNEIGTSPITLILNWKPKP
jgi:Tol biopolymer transport system component